MKPSLFAKNFKALRLQKGFTITAMASDAGFCTYNNIWTWEQGSEPGYQMLIRIAAYFEITIDDLLTKHYAQTNDDSRKG